MPESPNGGSAATNAAVQKPLPVPETVASVHWIGTKALLEQTNAASIKKIWALPETARLAAHALDKLSLGLVKGYPLASTNVLTWVTNYPALLATNKAALALRPLLQDLTEQETYIEVRHLTNQPGELVLAVRLDETRAGAWAANLATVVESLSGLKPTPAASNALSWAAIVTNSPWNRTDAPQHIELARAGGWTLLGIAPAQNQLLQDFTRRIQSGAALSPVLASGGNYWFETTANLAGLSSALQLEWKLPEALPTIWLASTGQGEEVLSRGRLTFAQTLPAELPAWNIPTNLIHDPLHSFTVARGFGPWLSSQPYWKELDAGEPPGQLVSWSETGSPFLSYFATAVPNASNMVDQISGRLIDLGNPILATNRMGVLEPSTNFHGLSWKRVPIINPFLKSEELDGREFIWGGLAPLPVTNASSPAAPIAELFGRTNLVLYHREVTPARLEALMYVGQLSRIIFRRPQMPGDSPTFLFFKSLLPVIGASRTIISKVGTSELALERTSSLGLTGMEMHFLADWLESPEFPSGLHSFCSEMPPLPVLRTPVAGTNVVPPR